MKRLPTCVLAIDQAAESGFAFIGAGQVRASKVGTAKTADERAAAIASAILFAGGAKDLLVVLEDHGGFHFGRGNMSVASLLGMGAARGRWEEQLDIQHHPKSKRHKVSPEDWRRAVLGLGKNAKGERCKQDALLYARAMGFPEVDDNGAEALCIAVYGARVLLNTASGSVQA